MIRAAALLAALAAAPLAAQAPSSVRVGAAPDTVTVGDRFLVGVSAAVPPEARLELSIEADPRHQVLGDPRASRSEDGRARAEATMVAWVPGADTARALLRVVAPDGRTEAVPLAIALPYVRAVLPADSTDPRGAKDVIAPARARLTWAWIAAAALLIALVSFLLWVRRRRRRANDEPPVEPRAHALAELDRLRASGMLERGEVAAFCAGTSDVLRRFAAMADPALGGDLTTRELLDRLARNGTRPERLRAVSEALADADLAKFARRAPSPARAAADWEAARAWVAEFHAEDASADGSAEDEGGR